MKRHLPLLCITLALVILPGMAWAQNGGGNRQNRNGRNNNYNNRRASPTPAAAATPMATPTPTPAPAPGVITGLANGLITVSQGNPPVASAYKVTVYSNVTLNGQTVQFAALKVGMQVVIKPASDVSYAETITAVDAPPPPPPAPPAEAAPAPAAAPAAGAPAPAPPGAEAPAPTPAAAPAQ